MRVAVFPGSFDPITLGHEDIVRRASQLFDKIIVAIGVNSSKKYMFSLEERKQMLETVFSDLENLEVVSFQGLTTDFCAKIGAKWILRGVRNASDFEYECTIAKMNKKLAPSIETTILFTSEEYSSISSTSVREILAYQGDVSAFVPQVVSKYKK